MSTPLAKRIAEEHAAIAERLPSSVSNASQRRSAIATLVERGLPASRDENWKYANLRSIDRMRFTPVPAQTPIDPSKLPPAIEGYSRFVFVDGVFSAALSGSAAPCEGVSFRSMGAAEHVGDVARRLVSAANGAAQPFAGAANYEAGSGVDASFALLNDAFATDGAQITVAAGSRSTRCCLEVLFVATAESSVGASYPRINLVVEANAQLSLIERHLSVGTAASFVNSAVTVNVQKQSNVNHYRVQQVSPQATWMDTLSASVATDATYKLHAVELGAQSSRSTVQIKLAGERAELGFHVVSLGERNQVHDIYARVEHAAPRARTDESFRGIASGRSRVAFNGKIVVRAGAQGTDSRQSLRGLLAGKEAEIDVRPQLEIYTDDVKCSHGATAGKLDDAALFYLLSRGIDRETALKLLKWAFLEDVVSKIAVPELRKQIEQSLAGQLQDVGELKELL
jgi:Fe-S cluster assembly protein SufD